MTKKQLVRKERYCGMCDEWFPARVGKECPACGFDLSAPVVNLVDALREALPPTPEDRT